MENSISIESPPTKKLRIDNTNCGIDDEAPKSNNNDDAENEAREKMQTFSPIHPKIVHQTGVWNVSNDNKIIYRIPSLSTTMKKKNNNSTLKVLGLDMNRTIYDSVKQYPQNLQDYEIYNNDTITKLKKAYEKDNFTLILFINEGRIRSASNGKTAQKVKQLIEYIADQLNNSPSSEGVPLYALISTQKHSGLHKPNTDLWKKAEQILGMSFDKETSLFVGDGINREVEVERENNNEEEGKENKSNFPPPVYEIIKGEDEEFASNIGIRFQTPWDFFGTSNKKLRFEQNILISKSSMIPYSEPPSYALQERRDLRSKLLEGPILLLLCGAQGSGKSFFCEELLKTISCGQLPGKEVENPLIVNWKHYSQDTICNGTPGTRQDVENMTTLALEEGYNVVVDRMHLNQEQRSHFLELAKRVDNNIHVHILVFNTSKETIKERVKNRVNHIVKGKRGADLAVQSFNNLEMPIYEEGFQLISCTKSETGVERYVEMYRHVANSQKLKSSVCVKNNNTSTRRMTLPSAIKIKKNLEMPSVTLGTYKMNKSVTRQIIQEAFKLGFRGVDTAPTYNNETEIGEALALVGVDNSNEQNRSSFCTVKVPKRATSKEQVLSELNTSLQKLEISKADLLLLHWPSDVISMNTLEEVWKAMEQCVGEDKASSLGVCNFNINALRLLLPKCDKYFPVVNQVERHIRLPQWELINFCDQHDILVQAHSTLGQGSLLDDVDVIKVVKEEEESIVESTSAVGKILIQWNILQGIPVVTKCSSRKHLENAVEVLKESYAHHKLLSNSSMKELNNICKSKSDEKRLVNPPFMIGDQSYCWSLRNP